MTDTALRPWSQRPGPTDSDQHLVDHGAARRAWLELVRARADAAMLSAAEDGVFRLYLPYARALARRYAVRGDQPSADTAAELGLARAVLAWQRPDPEGFLAFARAAVRSELRHAGAPTRLRPWWQLTTPPQRDAPSVRATDAAEPQHHPR